ncbi:MAG TPA: hypothetical protein VHR66_13975 [Gemmataceae bacterium]|jgi:hypothetical protein|nr:hypothetical protein [Gemmataceae bacterium]
MSNVNDDDQPLLDHDGKPLGENSAPSGQLVLLLTLGIGVIAVVMFAALAWLKS